VPLEEDEGAEYPEEPELDGGTKVLLLESLELELPLLLSAALCSE
jgi:hypothetical protein